MNVGKGGSVPRYPFIEQSGAGRCDTAPLTLQFTLIDVRRASGNARFIGIQVEK
jgi:hypothetical protein